MPVVYKATLFLIELVQLNSDIQPEYMRAILGEIKAPFCQNSLDILPKGNHFTYGRNTPVELVHSLAVTETASAPWVLDLNYYLPMGSITLSPLDSTYWLPIY